MELKTIPLGDYQANCYSIIEGEELLLIDTGDEGEKLLQYIEKVGKKLVMILLTHGHFDHVGAVKPLKEAFPDCQVYIHKGDAKGAGNTIFPLEGQVEDLKFVEDGTKIPFGKGDVEVFATPGHSKGSICLKYQDNLFTGDTLFFGSMGRTDLPDGDFKEIMSSLAKLAKLDPNLKVFPGHGDSSTMGQELSINPYIQEALRQ